MDSAHTGLMLPKATHIYRDLHAQIVFSMLRGRDAATSHNAHPLMHAGAEQASLLHAL